MVYRIERFLQITKNATSHFLLLFRAFNVSFISLKMASSVTMPFLKPNWFPTSNLLVLKCAVSLLNRAFLKTFEKEVNNDLLDSFCYLS